MQQPGRIRPGNINGCRIGKAVEQILAVCRKHRAFLSNYMLDFAVPAVSLHFLRIDLPAQIQCAGFFIENRMRLLHILLREVAFLFFSVGLCIADICTELVIDRAVSADQRSAAGEHLPAGILVFQI